MYARLVRWAFARFYRELAWTYDRVAAAVSWGAWRSWALTAAQPLHGAVLELGCGTGYLQEAMADLPPIRVAVGLDLSRQMLALTRRRAPRARLLRADAGRMPFPPAQFDWVVATFPSEYIADPRTLAEIRRALAPGGQLLVVLGAQLAGPQLYRRLVQLAYRLTLLGAPPPPSAALPDPQLAAGGLLARMAEAGLRASARWEPHQRGAVLIVRAEAA